MTGLADAVGHTAMELVPDLEREWVEVYARAAIGGERLRFEQGSAAMGRWFDVFTMPVSGEGRFAIVFKDDTERHRAEIELRDSQEQLRRLADRQRDDLLRLQHALLPAAVVESEHVRIVAHYQSIAAGTDVGGDWYDTFRWVDGRVGVMVGDVVGHNLAAAAEMGHLRAGVGALARGQTGPGPSALLHALDECARGPDGTDFVTACCVVYDPSSGLLDHASAGHPPPLLVPPDLDARWLDGALTPPIGRIVVADRPHATAAVPAGSVVILYSDGLVERRGVDLDAQLERVRTHAVELVSAGRRRRRPEPRRAHGRRRPAGGRRRGRRRHDRLSRAHHVGRTGGRSPSGRRSTATRSRRRASTRGRPITSAQRVSSSA